MPHNIDVRGNRRVGISKHSKAKWRIKYREWNIIPGINGSICEERFWLEARGQRDFQGKGWMEVEN